MSEWPEIEVRNAAELRGWLAAQSAEAGSHWLIHGKKTAGTDYLPYGAMVEELLAFGWVDSRPRAIDGTRTAHLITPRKPGSVWSKDNRERIAKLEREGRMAPGGRAAVARAQQDGSWGALKPTEEGIAPRDLSEALDRGEATEGWNALSLATRRRALEYLITARRDATGTERIARIVAACAAGMDPSVWKPRA